MIPESGTSVGLLPRVKMAADVLTICKGLSGSKKRKEKRHTSAILSRLGSGVGARTPTIKASPTTRKGEKRAHQCIVL